MLCGGMTETERSHAALGVRAALALPAWIVGVSFLGVGSLARDAGHPLGAALLSTLLVWAAPAQLILYGSLARDGLIAAAALAVGLSGIRLLPMALAFLPLVRRPGQPLWIQFAAAHCMAATTWIEAMRRLPDMDEAGRLPFYFGFALTCLALSATATVLGFLLVGALPLPLAAGFLCLTPIYFTISLAAGARFPSDWLAIGLGLGLAPLAQTIVGKDFDLLATGIVGGTAAHLAAKRPLSAPCGAPAASRRTTKVIAARLATR